MRGTARLFGCSVALVLFLSGCASLGRRDLDLLPKQSPDATEVLLLQSNVNCQFFVDSQPLAVGRRVRIVVTKAGHRVVCKPDGYRAKEEYLQPPFDPGFPVGFTFLIEDRLAQDGAGSGGGALAPPAPARTLVSDADHPPKTAALPRKDAYAVLVGIEKYRDLPAVEFAAHDAEVLKRYLVESMGYQEENVAVLTDGRATRSDLEAYFKTWLANRVGPGDSVFVSFSGHGSPDPVTGDAYLVPYDGNPSFLKDSAYPLRKLYASLASLPSKDVFVLLDSCFSGAGGRSVIAKGVRPLTLQVDESVPAGSGLAVLSAASASQISSAYEGKAHGLLTYFFLRGLQGEADADNDRSITLAEVYDYLRPRVEQTARRSSNVEQTPQLFPPRAGIGGRGEEVFLKLSR
ncbi:MAG: caspase family protein [Elusimicrobiota bacterium]|jgi:hypothetical protein